MKIQKVEIQAFRAYDKVENGTFDFSTKSNGVADFVAIYAPNGFGKTSFYDAVEWGYTNRVSRFDRKKGFSAELARSERNYITENQEKKEQWIIRNRFSELEKGFVKLYTNSSSDPIQNDVPKVKKGQPDYKFEKQIARKGTSYFHEVLLSQEWIDAFLKEDNAATRYEKFIQSFGDVDLDEKYKTVVELIKINQEKIKQVKKELNGVQLKLKYDIDPELFSKINWAIEEFNTKDENLPKVDALYTDKDVLELTNLISERERDLHAEIKRLEERKEKLVRSLSGKQDELIGIETYFNLNDELADLNKQLELARKQKDTIKKREQTQEKISDQERELAKLLEEARTLEDLIKVYTSFVDLQKKIAENEQKVNTSKKEISQLKETLLEVDQKIGRSNVSKKSKQLEYEELLERLKLLPEIEKKLSLLGKEQKSTEESKETTSKSLEAMKSNIVEKEAKKMSLVKFQKDIENNLFPTNEHQHYEQYKNVIDKIRLAKEQLKKVESNLEKTQAKLSDVDSINQELKALIEQGTSIVNRNQSSSCPLCQHDYESYSELAQKISNNPLLSNRVNELLEEKNELEVEQSQLSKGITDNTRELIAKLIEDVEKFDSSIAGMVERRELLNQSIDDLSTKQTSLKHQIGENLQRLKLSEYPPEDFETKLKKEVEEARLTLGESLNSIEKLSKEKTDIERKIKIHEEAIDSAEKNIKDCENESDFQRFVAFREKRFLEEFPSKKLLDDIEASNKKKIDKVKGDLEDLLKILEGLKEQITGVEIEKVESRIAGIESKKEASKIKVRAFENHLKDLNISFSDSSQKELTTMINQQNEETRKATDLAEAKMGELAKIEAYRENIIPFLEYQENQRIESELKNEKVFLEKVVSKQLHSEKEGISKFIHDQVESFFYQGLINTLYQKIDPHPSYKNISFKCDFSGAKPMLNIFVSDETKTTIVPTLYFSTAQLNILSLSIFLAKALNVKNEKGEPVDCIFIDDPIQSMDSINILSTIDLFRSIVVNLGKQIILSTHDENFQNLLKKKMPAELFPAKYLELETFGKVKAQ